MLRKIRYDELKKATGILTEGFRDYPLYDAFYPDPDRKMRCMYDFFLIRMYSRRNYTYVTDNLSFIICVEKPGDKPVGNLYFSHPLIALDVIFHSRISELKRFLEFMELASAEEARYRKPEDWNIQIICKNRDYKDVPDLQAVLEELHADAPLFCETHSPAHVRLYRRYGFQVMDRADFYGVTHYILRRDTVSTF